MNTFNTLTKKQKIIFITISIIALGGIISTCILLNKIQYLENPSLAVENETKQLVSDISKYIVLPTDETPTIATVSDPEKLRDQPFFMNSKVGDKVLIYNTARKAILWRPSTSKIIEISSINTNPAPAQTNTTVAK